MLRLLYCVYHTLKLVTLFRKKKSNREYNTIMERETHKNEKRNIIKFVSHIRERSYQLNVEYYIGVCRV